MTTKKKSKINRKLKNIDNKNKKINKNKNVDEIEKDAIKKTNVILIKKKGMTTEIKTLCRDITEMFNPYCIVFYINKLKNVNELNNKLKELSYKFSISTYIQNLKLFYKITSNYTKLALTFIIQSYTTSGIVKSVYSKNLSFDYKRLRPLLILKNFNNTQNPEMANYLIIVQNILKSLYPSVSLTNDFTHKPRRVLLYCYNSSDNSINFRQYTTNFKSSTFEKIIGEAYKIKDSNENVDIYKYISNRLINDNNTNEDKDNEHNLVEIGPRINFAIFKITDQDKVIYSMSKSK
ncbi:BRIX domain, putative [Plasmodium berghei]|uniref:BRIX domain, putative n=2 Tax=Plasmodium berghei TaxID=5821 RepID=A0A509AHS6_PLABA|nr:BRIX domain, putative [Plasmodium berghei ANKA]SCM20348.1 BRIX domain, putative [Plasmodium berghei]SCN23950.1 BRIX domain, putative [Plasmodium berghei]SCO59324.1 BRIX domain, putative [Plasmodium berghei]SCO60395.1 BRIX domain, putative [Plasmodium berghei]VUC55043.1 BRIX domain, putative [Plasmodium berghei ANKA]|eukprot:XP_034420862.1 BRIX domain, putative [Plasmodium berghei ANKA]